MRTLFIAFFVANIAMCNGQQKLITLKNEPLTIPVKGFYILDVIDGRENQNNIGFALVGMFNKKVDVNLVGGTENAILKYLKNSLPSDVNGAPIIIKILHLDVSEQINFTSEKGRAEIKVEFYRYNDGELGKFHTAESFREEPALDATLGHEKRIREVLATCISSFNDADWQSVTPIYDTQEQIIREKTDIAGTSFSSVRDEPIKWRSMLTFSPSYGINSVGFSLSYNGYYDTGNNWIIPWGVSIEQFTIDTEYFSQFDYREAQLGYWMPGISGLRKINDYFFFKLGMFIPVGNETLTDFYGREKDHFIIGIAPSQGIYFIPKSNFGFTLGVGVYQKALTSEVFKHDLGVKAEIGIKF